MDTPQTPRNKPFPTDNAIKFCSISTGQHILKCGHQISTVPGDQCGENCAEAGPELFFTCISCTDFVTIKYLVEHEIKDKWKRLSMQGIKLLENSLQNTLLDLGREIVAGRFNARGRGCKQVPTRHADTVKLILAFRLKGIASALIRVESVADIEPELLLFCSDFMGPTPIDLEAHLNELSFMKQNMLGSQAEFRSMMVKTTTIEYLFLVMLEEESLKRMVEGFVEATQATIETQLQPKGHQHRLVNSFLHSQTEELRSVSPTPSFKEAKKSGAYYQPHPDNEISPTRSRPPAWKYEAGLDVHSPSGNRKLDTPMGGKFDSPIDGKFDSPMQGGAPIAPIPNTASSPETSAVRKLSFAATRGVFEVNSKPPERTSERFPRIQHCDTANSSRIREPAKLAHETGKENEDPLPRSNVQKYSHPQVAAPRRGTVGSGYGPSRREATPAAQVTRKPSAPSDSLIPCGSQLPSIHKAVAPANSQKGNARLTPSRIAAASSLLGSSGRKR